MQNELDHDAVQGENLENLTFTIDGTFDVSGALSDTDYDVDPTASNLTADFQGQSFTVSVIDDVPVAVDDALQSVKEGGYTITGNVLTNDTFGADQVEVIRDGDVEVTQFQYDYDEATGTYAHTATIDPVTGSGTVTTAEGGTLTVNSDGSWSYTSPANVTTTDSDGDGVNDAYPLQFDYTIVDDDGDTSTATQPIEITDDGPDFDPWDPNTRDHLVDEADLAWGTSPTAANLTVGRDILVDFGADGPAASDALVFTEANIDALYAMGLTSEDAQIQYGLSADGLTIYAWVGSPAADPYNVDPSELPTTTDSSPAGGSYMVYEITISGDATSGYQYDYTLYAEIDNDSGVSENTNVEFDFEIKATDGDGTWAKTEFTVNVVDDEPIAADDPMRSTYESGATVGGNVFTGTNYGAAWVGKDVIGADDLESGEHPLVAVDYVDENGNVATIDFTTGAFEQTVTTYNGGILTINADGEWSYVPPDNIDHVDADGDGVNDPYYAAFRYYIQDDDGDQSLAYQVIEVKDRGPEITTGNATVDEANLLDGTDPDAALLTVNETITIDFGRTATARWTSPTPTSPPSKRWA